MHPARDQAGEMRHVDHQIGVDLVGHGAEPGEVDDPRIGAAAGNDQFGPMFSGQAFEFVVVDAAVLTAYAVLNRVEPLAR